MSVPKYLLLKNCKIYKPPEVKALKDISIEKGKIKKITEFISPEKKYKIINCKGKIVTPGFIDVHIHGAGGSDFLNSNQENLFKISATLSRYGVTSFLATTVITRDKEQKHLKILSEYVGKELSGSNLLGIHLEGPFINIRKRGMIRKESIKNPSLRLLHNLIKITNNNIKMMTIAPELKGNIRIIKELKKYNIVSAIGHTMANIDETTKGIKVGINHVTHLFNAMSPLHHRHPGVIGAVLINKAITYQVIADGKHIHPVVLKMIYQLLGGNRIVLISDGMPSMGLKDGEYVYHNLKYKAKDGTCFYRDGTLIGSALPLNKMAKRMMDFTGATFSDVLKMITVNPAKVLNLKNKGVIEVNKDADIVITNENFDIFKVIIDGKIFDDQGL